MEQEAGAAQLLSQLTRLDVLMWHSSGPSPQGRAQWLSQLKEVVVAAVDLPAVAALPADVCIAAGKSHEFNITCTEDETEEEVREGAARLHDSPAVRCGSSVLGIAFLRAAHCKAIRPLAEAVTLVRGWYAHNRQLHRMVGWRLRCLDVDAFRISEHGRQFVQTVGSMLGLHVHALRLKPLFDSNLDGDRWAAAIASMARLCRGLQGLQHLKVCRFLAAPHKRQLLQQKLQAAVGGLGVQVQLD